MSAQGHNSYVYVVVYSHEHGTDVRSVHRTGNGATRAAAAIADEEADDLPDEARARIHEAFAAGRYSGVLQIWDSYQDESSEAESLDIEVLTLED